MNFTPFATAAFRCVPHSTTEPLATLQSLEFPGRWNTSTVPGFYTFLSVNLAQTWVEDHIPALGPNLDDLTPEVLPDLLRLDCTPQRVADLTTVASLEEVGLPANYPEGFYLTSTYPVTQAISEQLYNSGCDGILVRSASAGAWTGQLVYEAELVLIGELTTSVVVLERLPYPRWLLSPASGASALSACQRPESGGYRQASRSQHKDDKA